MHNHDVRSSSIFFFGGGIEATDKHVFRLIAFWMLATSSSLSLPVSFGFRRLDVESNRRRRRRRSGESVGIGLSNSQYNTYMCILDAKMST